MQWGLARKLRGNNLEGDFSTGARPEGRFDQGDVGTVSGPQAEKDGGWLLVRGVPVAKCWFGHLCISLYLRRKVTGQGEVETRDSRRPKDGQAICI